MEDRRIFIAAYLHFYRHVVPNVSEMLAFLRQEGLVHYPYINGMGGICNVKNNLNGIQITQIISLI